MSDFAWPPDIHPLPHVATDNSPRTFIYPNGAPISIFVDAGEVPNSPRLLRTIRSAGANIVHFPSSAQIILIDSTVDSGRQYVRDWSGDPDKMVLEYTWVRKCIDAGRALLADDGWGGSVAIDDGETIAKGDDEFDNAAPRQKSLLSTSRQTPSGSENLVYNQIQSQHNESFQLPQIHTNSQHSDGMHSATSSRLPSTPRRDSLAYPLAHEYSNLGNSHVTPTHSSNSRSPRRDFLPSSLSFDASYVSSQQQPNYNMAANVAGSQFPHSQVADSARLGIPPMQSDPGVLAMNNGPSMGMGMNVGGMGLGSMNMGSHVGANAALPSSLANANLIAAMMDMIRHQGQLNPQGWAGQGQQIMMGGMPNPTGPFANPLPQFGGDSVFHPQQPTIFPGQTPGTNGSMAPPSSAGSVVQSAATSGSMMPFSGEANPFAPATHKSPTLSAIPDSVRRRKSPTSSSSSEYRSRGRPRSKAKDKKKSHSRKHDGHAREPQARRKRSPSPTSESDEAESIVISPVGSPPPRSQPPPTGSPRKAGEIFRSESGKPLSFFVQVDLRNRFQLIQKIKKNGGQIIGDHLQANYAILFSRSAAFKDLLAGVQSAGMHALTPLFVDDCLEAGALLEIDEGRGHIIAPSPGLGKNNRAKASKETTPETRKKRREWTNAWRSRKRAAERADDGANAGAPSTVNGKATVGGSKPLSHVRSPSPPPLQPQMKMAGGRWLFSSEEKKFVLQYATVLLHRDIGVSNSLIASKMCQKMPHHPHNSWYGFISTKCKAELEDIRKRVGIASRKALHASAPVPVLESPKLEVAAAPSKRQKLHSELPKQRETQEGPAPPTPKSIVDGVNHQDMKEDEREDFDAICEFFASGGGNDSDDEQVWLNLTNHKQCKTNSDWAEFYKERQREINEQIKELMRAAGGNLHEDEKEGDEMEVEGTQ